MNFTRSISTQSKIKFFTFFQAEDGIRDLVRSRGLGDVYKRQIIIPYVYFGENLINLISGRSFLDAYEPMLVLTIGYIIYLNTFWIRQLLLFSNLIQYHALSRLISLATFSLASFLFVTQFGAVGIAIALSLSMIVQKFYEFYAFNKYSEQN